MDRRRAIQSTMGISGVLLLHPLMALAKESKDLSGLQFENLKSEADWRKVRNQFHIRKDLINLHNGMSPTTRQALASMSESYAFMSDYPMDNIIELFKKQAPLRAEIARLLDCLESEIALTSSTTEGVNIVVSGLKLKDGEEILWTNQEYPSITDAIELRTKRSSVVSRKVDLPFAPKDISEHIDAVSKAINKKTKLLVISHITCRGGEILPIKEIVEIAHKKGVEVLVDGAHSFGHIEFSLKDLGCDYFAASLHKWMAGPVGGGFLYIHPEKISNVWPLMGYEAVDEKSMFKFENFFSYGSAARVATMMTIDLHNKIGPARKQKRLTELRLHWMEALRDNKKITMHTPFEGHRAAGMGAFRIEGANAHELTKKIKAENKIALGASGPPEQSRLRVTPNIFTSIDEMDKLIAVIRKI